MSPNSSVSNLESASIFLWDRLDKLWQICFLVILQFFYQQNYDKARFCFEKAAESYLEKWAMAAGHVSTADQMRDSNPKMADNHLTEAAHIYETIGKNESAAQCFFELHEYEKAGIHACTCFFFYCNFDFNYQVNFSVFS